MKLTSLFNWAGMSLLTAMVLLGAGCQTQDGGQAGPLASVVISNQPMTKVQSTIADVFAEHGFLGGRSGANEFTFTRVGVNPGGASAALSDVAQVKAVVTTVQASSGEITVSCNAQVLNPNSQTQSIRRWPYQQLLNQVKSDVSR